jgi:hypothetical protein
MASTAIISGGLRPLREAFSGLNLVKQRLSVISIYNDPDTIITTMFNRFTSYLEDQESINQIYSMVHGLAHVLKLLDLQ